MLPTFLIIGAAKCGTTSLSYYLSLHPEIFMYREREPHFFSSDLGAGKPLDAPIRSLDAYERLFPSAPAARGESSPSYSQYPARPGVPGRIRKLLPDVKLIYLVRDPIERVISHHLHQVARGGERRSFPAALGDLDDPMNTYVCTGLYAMQLRQYLDHFDAEQILVVDQAALTGDRLRTLRLVFGFLSVDAGFSSDEFDRQLNTAADALRWVPGNRTLLGRVGRAVRSRLPPGFRQRAKAGAERLASKVVSAPARPQIEPALRERLIATFQDEVSELRALTGQRFESWSL